MPVWEKAALGALLFGATCSACHGPLVPTTPRPDTRRIEIVRLDSLAMSQTMQILQAALPNETAVCYLGRLYDSTVATPDGPHNTRVLRLTHATEAISDSTDEYHVYYSHSGAGCGIDVVAIGHSHPYAGGGLCTHSVPDANVLFLASRILVSIVWCGDGRAQVMYQDGRREDVRWRDAP